MTNIVRLFQGLGEDIDQEWGGFGHREESFAAIAKATLLRSGILSRFSSETFFKQVLECAQLPLQDKHDFGEPSITVYATQDFHIQILVWMDGTTTIHEHAFYGIFAVLEGSSLHTTFRFTSTDSVGPLRVGRLDLVDTEVLRTGDVRTIPPPDLPHSLFHLERPSISLVIRTHKRIGMDRQYNYFHPGVAIDPCLREEGDRMRVRLLRSLASTAPPLFWESAAHLLADSNLWLSYQILELGFEAQSSSPLSWQELLRKMGFKHGDQTRTIINASFHNRLREKRLVHLRSKIVDIDHRFVLALLMNLADKAQILRLIGTIHPDQASAELLLKWLAEMFLGTDNDLTLTHLEYRLLAANIKDTPEEVFARELGEMTSEQHLSAPGNQMKLLQAKLRAKKIYDPLLRSLI